MYSDSSPYSERTLMKKIFQGVSEANDKMIGYFSFDTPSKHTASHRRVDSIPPTAKW